jgi:prefoldin alpha subunit
MVPLTQSLYVPGFARDVKNVTVELGTGFYATKTVPEAQKFLQRKIDLVGKNADWCGGGEE